MTPIPFDIPPGRTLPPTVAYAAGLVCEHRPDLADGVRAAVLGEDRAIAFDGLILACIDAKDEPAVGALSCLREIVHYGGLALTDLQALAVLLGVTPAPDNVAKIIDRDGVERIGDPTIGDVVLLRERTPATGHPYGAETYSAVGISNHRTTRAYRAFDDAAVLMTYLREGFATAWARVPRLRGAVVPLFAIVTLHAHTVSLDPAARAAWAKAHLDALADPVRPQSPDRLN